MAQTVAFLTLGCKVNQYDTQAMLEKFEEKGYTTVPANTKADVYVVNTCTVTGTGDKKSLQMIRRCQRKNPAAEIVVSGCLAQRMGEELRSTGARLIIGTQHRGEVVELLEEAIRENKQTVAVGNVEHVPFERLSIHSHEGFTRAVMKIQEGCDNRCTYCIIPKVRGGIRSRTPEDICQEAEALVKAGFRELVLTGIHLTSYGRDLPEHPSLAEAVEQVCAIPGVERVRLGSLEPRVATQEFVDRLKVLPQVCPQFHLALQSGSDNVLRRMKRTYNTTQFREAAKRIREAWPMAALTTDVIVGFPGETEAEFEQTMEYCREIGFMKIHVFPFSPREGTPAAQMPDQIPENTKSERVRRLMDVSDRTSQSYREAWLGRTVQVLFEEELPDGTLGGHTPEYVYVTAEGVRSGEICQVMLTGLTQEGMCGTAEK